MGVSPLLDVVRDVGVVVVVLYLGKASESSNWPFVGPLPELLGQLVRLVGVAEVVNLVDSEGVLLVIDVVGAL